MSANVKGSSNGRSFCSRVCGATRKKDNGRRKRTEATLLISPAAFYLLQDKQEKLPLSDEPCPQKKETSTKTMTLTTCRHQAVTIRPKPAP